MSVTHSAPPSSPLARSRPSALHSSHVTLLPACPCGICTTTRPGLLRAVTRGLPSAEPSASSRGGRFPKENGNARTCTTPAAFAAAHIPPPGCSFARTSAGVTLRRDAPRSGAGPVSGLAGLEPPVPSNGSIGGASAGESIVRNRRGPSAASRSSRDASASASRAAASEEGSSVASADARRRANTYRLPVFAPSTTCVSLASRHRNRTRGPTTLVRSDVSATARQREWAATILLGSVASARSPRVRRPTICWAAARLGDCSPLRCPPLVARGPTSNPSPRGRVPRRRGEWSSAM